MRATVRELIGEATAVMRDDLNRDPYLRYILVLAFILCSAWLWYRVPNFATPDEYGRLLRPMKAAGYFLAEGSFSAFVRGATDGVAQGATFYLYGITLLPVFLIVVVTGQLGQFSSLAGIESRWMLWHEVPAWFWTSSVLVARFANVLFAVGGVYLMYRLGTEIRNRRVGRLAAVLLTLSLGFVASAHEANEDTAAVFLLLGTLYLSLRFVRTNDNRLFYTGCLLGGVAIAFKLTAGIVVFFLGFAVVLRLAETPPDRRTVGRFGALVVIGAVLGGTMIYVGRPNILFFGPTALIDRMTVSLSSKAEPLYVDTPPGGLLLLAYLNSVGLPLFVAMVLGLFGGFHRVWRNGRRADAEVLLLAGLLVFIGIVGQWANLKTHHILPTVPLLILLASSFEPALRRRLASQGRLLLAVLLITSSLYVTIGVVQYASDPRDQATRWLKTETAGDEAVLVYENSVADIGVIHRQPVIHYDFVEKVGVSNQVRDEADYTQWMVTSPERRPDVIQLTDAELRYLDSTQELTKKYPKRAAFVRRLVYGDHYGYEIVDRYGNRQIRTTFHKRLILAGIRPDVEKIEDEVIILRKS